MKTNLDSIFKSDKSCEQDGVIFDCGNGVTFTLRRFGGYNDTIVNEKVAKKNKPYAFQIQKGTIDPKITERIRAEVFCEVCLVNWTGLLIDDKEVPFSQEKAAELMLERPDLFNHLFSFACNFDNYKADVGNS